MTRKGLPYSVEKQPAAAKKYQHHPQTNSIFQKIIITPKQAPPTFAQNLCPQNIAQKFGIKYSQNGKKSQSTTPKMSISLTILLSATAVFTTLSVDWSVFNELMFPKLSDFHTKHNIEKLAVHRQRREAELNKTTLSSTRNSAFISHDPSMNFILQDVKEIPLDEWNKKNGGSVGAVELVTEGPKNFEKYLYPSSEYVPLGSLERIYITTGYHGLRFYKQGHQIPPGYSPELYFTSIDPLKKRGFDTFSDDKFMEMLDDENFQDFEFGDHSKKGNWKVFDPELPCLKPKDDWEDWGRSLSLDEPVTESPKKLGGGGGGGGNRKLTDDDIQSLEAPGGKPIGCCNGKPFSNKKRCCCRRKSYNIETDFCCARDGCANFEVFGNTGENKEACVAAGGIVVLHEKFDYSATPMLGWAKEQSEKKDTEEEIQDKYAEELEKRYENYELHGKAELEIDGVEDKKVYKGFGDTKRRRKLAYWKRKQKKDGESEVEIEIDSEGTEILVMDDDFEKSNMDEIVIIDDSDPEDFGYAKSGESSKWKKSRKYWDKQLTSWDHLRSNLPNAGEPDALQSIIFNG